MSMAHYEFQGTLIKCLADIDKHITTKDLGCKTKIVIDIDNGKDEKKVRSQVVRPQPDAREMP